MPVQVAPPGPIAAEDVALDDPRLYVNRELSLLKFQWRVLEARVHRKLP